MNIIGKLWVKWKARHRHVYTERKISGEKWRTVVFLVEATCTCGKSYYHLSTPWGPEKVDQTWARLHFPVLKDNDTRR